MTIVFDLLIGGREVSTCYEVRNQNQNFTNTQHAKNKCSSTTAKFRRCLPVDSFENRQNVVVNNRQILFIRIFLTGLKTLISLQAAIGVVTKGSFPKPV